MSMVYVVGSNDGFGSTVRPARAVGNFPYSASIGLRSGPYKVLRGTEIGGQVTWPIALAATQRLTHVAIMLASAGSSDVAARLAQRRATALTATRAHCFVLATQARNSPHSFAA
jgi:hypothetical protein